MRGFTILPKGWCFEVGFFWGVAWRGMGRGAFCVYVVLRWDFISWLELTRYGAIIISLFERFGRVGLSNVYIMLPICLTVSFSTKRHYFFWNAITAYRNVPLANPLLMARKACRNAKPSRPCEKANAQSAGD